MFTVDNRTETFLSQMGVKFEYKNGILLPSSFAKDWKKENIGRPVAVREEAVIEYASLMESGSAAPAPILLEAPAGFRVLDGVQRLVAAEMCDTTRVSAYVVTTTSEDVVASIRVLANARLQGRPEPPEWTRRRAVEVLVVDRRMSIAEVALMGGWKQADIARIASAIVTQKKIHAGGGPSLPDTMLYAISERAEESGVLDKGLNPVSSFLHILKRSQLSAKDAEEYLDEFFAPLPKSCNPFATYAKRLDEVQEDPEIQARVTGRKHVGMPPDVVLLRTLRSAKTSAEALVMSGEQIVNVDEYFKLLKKIRDTLMSVCPHKKKKTARVPADMWSKSQ
jgi:hypothetical protein